ncbi:MAG: hypothetical protein ABIN90_06685 [Knoellia sp.]
MTQHSILPVSAVEALLVDTTPYLSCDECFERLDTHAEAVIADPDHRDVAMEHHLRGCAACDDEAQSLIALLNEH